VFSVGPSRDVITEARLEVGWKGAAIQRGSTGIMIFGAVNQATTGEDTAE
jgi:hypothetical protein